MSTANKQTHLIRTSINTTIPPVICLVGYSGSGKTTVMVQLIAELKRQGIKVGTIKHDAHGFTIDNPGKDSYRHKAAGAAAAIITSPTRIAMVADADHDHSPEELLPMLPHMDMVLVEGFKRSKLPKIEVFRPETGKGEACKGDPHLIAVVSDAQIDWGVRRFSTSEIEALAVFVLDYSGLKVNSKNT